MSWTDDTNDNTEQEEKLIALGLMDVENELRKNNKLVADLKKEQREQYENTNNELQERIAFEIQNLKNQKERDMEDLAYKIAQQLQNNSDDIYQKYIESSKTRQKRINFQHCDGCRACVSQYQRADFCVFVFLDFIWFWIKANYEFNNT